MTGAPTNPVVFEVEFKNVGEGSRLLSPKSLTAEVDEVEWTSTNGSATTAHFVDGTDLSASGSRRVHEVWREDAGLVTATDLAAAPALPRPGGVLGDLARRPVRRRPSG